MRFQAPRGTKDIYGTEAARWHQLEKVLKDLCADFCVHEIRTPVFENIELFQRGIGDTTDIVQKEMFTMEDKGDKTVKSFALRPEGTAGAVRAYIENSMYGDTQPVKLYYMGPIFRKEKPQKGRMRQFHQFGVEIMGSYNPACDAEVISIPYELFRRLGIQNIRLHINSLGQGQCRADYNNALKAFIGDNMAGLCPLCRDRVERNPLRVLDCKEEQCKKVMAGAPTTIDYLDDESKEHFEQVKQMLDAMGIAYFIDSKLVRGLDYYTRTVFEFISDDENIGAQSTVCGGGRYDNLIEECGGAPNGCVGFAIGMERVLLAMESQWQPEVDKPDIFIGNIGSAGAMKAQALIYALRQSHIRAIGDALGRSVKAQMKYADKTGARYSLIIGDNEIAEDKGRLKNMETGEQIDAAFSDLPGILLGGQ